MKNHSKGRPADGNSAAFAFTVFLVYYVNLVLYPQWNLPGLAFHARYSLAALYVFFAAAAYYAAGRFAVSAGSLPAPRPGEPAAGGDAGFMAAFGAVSLITHAPYFFLPLTTLGDAHMHAGLPALSWARFSYWFAGVFGFNPRFAAITAAAAAAALLFFRRGAGRTRRGPAAAAVLLAAGAVYALIILRSGFFEKFGPMEHFLRYPVLGKLIYFSIYSVFGISEWAGRASQLAFLFAGAVYFKKLLELTASRTAARCGYAAFLMFPPFWNYGHHNYLEAGVLFFAAAVMHYLLLFLKTSSRAHLFRFTVLCLLAVSYKEYLPGLIPVSAAVAACFHLVERKLRKGEIAALCGALAFPAFLSLQYILVFNYLRSLYDYYPQPVRAGDLFSFERLAVSLGNIPGVTGGPLAALSAAGIAAGIKKFRRAALYMLTWFFVFWILISASTGYAHPRTNLIFYIPLCAFICFLAGGFKKLAAIMPCAVFILFSWVSLLAGPGEGVSTGETVPLGRLGSNIYPYDELFAFIKENGLYESRIYAPMVCEPSHFYMAVNGILSAEFLDREAWEGRAAGFRQFLADGSYGYAVIPRGSHTDEILRRFLDDKLIDDIFSGRIEGLEPFKIFRGPRDRENRIYLFSFHPNRTR